MPVIPLEALYEDEPELVELVGELATLPPGLVLTSGQATSGKITTMAGIITRMARGAPVVVLATNREPYAHFAPWLAGWSLVDVGNDTPEAWRASMQGQPTDALLALMLTRQNAEAVLEASAGRWVFAAVDTALLGLDVAYALREMMVPYEDFLGRVRCVWSQLLLETLCEHCAATVSLAAREREDLFPMGGAPAGLRAERGCPECGGRGTKSRTAACEVVVLDPQDAGAAREAVLQGQPYASARLHWRLHDHARRHLEAGRVGIGTFRDLVRRNPLLRAQNQLEREQAHSSKLGTMFEKFVSPEVRRRLMDSASLRTVVEGQICDVTCLFCDIRGFTRRAEACPPERLFRELNAYFAEVVDAVLENEGTIDKFIGDAVMVVFGAPLAQPDHAQRALACALAIRERVASFNERESRDLPIEIGIGLNSGPAAAGCVGTDQRMEYTVLGDTVNIAARLEASAAPGQILISASSMMLAGPGFHTRPCGAMRLKGKAQDVDCFELLALGR